MKTNLNKQTKYYMKYWDSDSLQFKLDEIHLNRDNWFYVQVDASIRTIFYKHGLSIPKYVIVQKTSVSMIFNIFRDNIKNVKELAKWEECHNYIESDLKIQAECNSTSDYDPNKEYPIKYEFKLL